MWIMLTPCSGTVGLSLGYPDYNPSFSGQFRTFSKLVIIAMQIRGRHRGLPYQVDRAVSIFHPPPIMIITIKSFTNPLFYLTQVLLPSESLLRDKRLQRRPSFVSTGLTLGRTISLATARTNRTRERPITRDGVAHHQDQGGWGDAGVVVACIARECALCGCVVGWL